jgi:hypothetical protein
MFLQETSFSILSIMSFVGLFCALLYLIYLVKCPICGAKLAQTYLQNTNMKYCPGCGIDFSAQE